MKYENLGGLRQRGKDSCVSSHPALGTPHLVSFGQRTLLEEQSQAVLRREGEHGAKP